MGTASAIPENLYQYSNQGTHAAQQLQNWVHSVLTPAMRDFVHGARHKPDGADIDISAVSSRAHTVDSDLPKHISTAYYTDRNVHNVGLLFQQAGSKGTVGMPGLLYNPLNQLPPATQTVDTTDATLDQRDMADGAALARGTMAGAPLDSLPALPNALGSHADDPLFCAGYYNALGRDQLETLTWNADTAQALASAYASGKLTHDAQENLAYVLINRESANLEVPTKVFDALAANPQGAANFARFLMSDRKAMKLFLKADGWGQWYPGLHDDKVQAQFIKGLFTVFNAAVPQLNSKSPGNGKPSELLEFADAVGKDLPKLDLKQVKAIQPELQQFLTSTAGSLLSLPSSDPHKSSEAALQEWAADYGVDMETLLQPYESWLNNMYADNKDRVMMQRALVENVALGTVGVVLTGPAAGSAALSLAANGAYGGSAGVIQPYIDGWLGLSEPADGPQPNVDPQNYLRKSALFAVVGRVYQQGLVSGNNGQPATLHDFLNDPTYGGQFAAMLRNVQNGGHPQKGDESALYNLKLKGGGDLGAIIDAMDSHFR